MERQSSFWCQIGINHEEKLLECIKESRWLPELQGRRKQGSWGCWWTKQRKEIKWIEKQWVDKPICTICCSREAKVDAGSALHPMALESRPDSKWESRFIAGWEGLEIAKSFPSHQFQGRYPTIVQRPLRKRDIYEEAVWEPGNLLFLRREFQLEEVAGQNDECQQ